MRLDCKRPVLFRQRRYGFNNELIEIYKYHSMYVDLNDANAVRLVSKGGPRVTRIGRLIRTTSIDELPSFSMSYLGSFSGRPGPHATQAKAQDALCEQVVDGYFLPVTG